MTEDAAEGGLLASKAVIPRARIEPFHLLAAVAAAWFILGTLGPIRDIDSYWHVRLATEFIDFGYAGAGRDWSFAVDNPDWRSTQWLSELAMGAFHSLWGWAGLVVFRGLAALFLVAALSWTTLRGVPARASVPVFLLAAITLAVAIQDRPMLLALTPVPFLAVMWRRAVAAEGAWPRWWLLLPAVVLYANLHGIWVLVPSVIGLAVLGRWLDHGVRDPGAWRGIALAGGCVAAGTVSPLGLANVTAVLTFRSSTAQIAEWQPSDLSILPAWTCAAMAGLAIVAWARGTHSRPLRSEVLAVLTLLVFAFTAFRNLAPAALLLAPIVAQRCAFAWDVQPSPTSRSEARILAALSATIVAGSVGVAAVSWWTRDPLPDTLPFGIAERLEARNQPIRLFNEYNAAGAVLGFTNQVQVGVDGRADYYGSTYIADYGAVIDAKPGSFVRFEAADPDAALLAKDAPLVDVLKGRGWTITDREGDWVLLEPPAGQSPRPLTGPIPEAP